MNFDIIEISFNDQRNKHMRMIKAIDINDEDTGMTALTSLENIVIMSTYNIKTNKECINRVCLCDGSEWDTLLSCDGQHVCIKNMHASTYEEFLVALDLHNCIYHVSTDEEIPHYQKSSVKMSNLISENAKLKQQLKAITKILKGSK